MKTAILRLDERSARAWGGNLRAASKDEARPTLTTARVALGDGKLTSITTDSYRLAGLAMPANAIDGDDIKSIGTALVGRKVSDQPSVGLFPAKLLGLALARYAADLATGGPTIEWSIDRIESITFPVGSGPGYGLGEFVVRSQPDDRHPDDRYPDVAALLPMMGPADTMVDTFWLAADVRRGQVMAPEGTRFDGSGGLNPHYLSDIVGIMSTSKADAAQSVSPWYGILDHEKADSKLGPLTFHWPAEHKSSPLEGFYSAMPTRLA